MVRLLVAEASSASVKEVGPAPLIDCRTRLASMSEFSVGLGAERRIFFNGHGMRPHGEIRPGDRAAFGAATENGFGRLVDASRLWDEHDLPANADLAQELLKRPAPLGLGQSLVPEADLAVLWAW